MPPTCPLSQKYVNTDVGKQTKTPVLKIREGTRAKYKLEKVYSDKTGPEAVTMNTGERYMLILLMTSHNFLGLTYSKRNPMPKPYQRVEKHLLKLKQNQKSAYFAQTVVENTPL